MRDVMEMMDQGVCFQVINEWGPEYPPEPVDLSIPVPDAIVESK